MRSICGGPLAGSAWPQPTGLRLPPSRNWAPDKMRVRRRSVGLHAERPFTNFVSRARPIEQTGIDGCKRGRSPCYGPGTAPPYRGRPGSARTGGPLPPRVGPEDRDLGNARRAGADTARGACLGRASAAQPNANTVARAASRLFWARELRSANLLARGARPAGLVRSETRPSWSALSSEHRIVPMRRASRPTTGARRHRPRRPSSSRVGSGSLTT
jgi:hypothetical protein